MGTYVELVMRYSYAPGHWKVDLHPDDTVVIACRGRSFNWLLVKDNKWMEKYYDTLVMVNDWSPQSQPVKFLDESSKKYLVNYLTDMATRRCSDHMHKLEDEGSLRAVRSSELLSEYKKSNPECSDVQSEAFVNAWKGCDTGLRCIATYSLLKSNVLIFGVDFWEADYWQPDDLNHEPNWNGDKRILAKMRKGERLREEIQERLLRWIAWKEDTVFMFWTYSESFKQKAESLRLSNLFVQHPDASVIIR